MSIDARTVSQLIQSNALGSVSPLSNTDSSVESNFSEILDGVMSLDSATTSSSVIPAEVAIQSMMQRLGMSPIINTESPDVSAPASTNSDFSSLISAAAAKYGVDPALIQGVIQAESNFDPNAVSGAGAKGLMQLMDGTAEGFGVSNSFDPAQNIDAGTNFLSGLLEKYNGSVPMTLAAYNAGPGRVDRMDATSESDFASKLWQLPSETQKYIPKVLGYYEQFKGQ